MAISNSSRTPGNQTLGADATSTSVTMTATVAGALSNSILLAFVQTNAGARSTSVAWDTAGVNEALTFFGEAIQGSERCEIWYKLTPTAGASKSLTANWSGSHQGCISCAVFAGVDQGTPWNAAGPQTATGAAGTDPSLTITTTTGEWAVDSMVGNLSGTTVNPPIKGASQNYIGAGIHTLNNSIEGGCSDQSSSGTSLTHTWDITQVPDPTSPWAQVGGSLVPAGAGGGPTTAQEVPALLQAASGCIIGRVDA